MSRIIGFLFLGVVLNFHSQVNIPKRGYAVDWILPAVSSNPTVNVFDKIELGINVQDSVERQIDTFLDEYDSEPENAKKMNPFKAEEIEIYAEFRQNKNESVKTVSAFYFENLVSDDVQNLKRNRSNTRFRIRFLPDIAANWNFKVYIKIKNKLIVTLGEYEFTCIESNSKVEKKVCTTHFNPCLGNDFWQKDLWLSFFSGLEESDIHWQDFQNFKTYENYKAFKNFTDEFEFKIIGLFNVKEKKLSENKCVELTALKQNFRSVGIIQNKTWNSYSSTENKCMFQKKPERKYRKFNVQKSSDLNTQIQISGFEKNHEYRLEWLNPNTNEFFPRVIVKSSNEGIIILEYPSLTKDLPYVIYRLG